jgi:hypothetical protein
MRLAPNLVWLAGRLRGGVIGELLQLDSFGKQDRRAGGEDLSVLGGHIFDLARLFCDGDARWCTAALREAGEELSSADLASGRVRPRWGAGGEGPFIADEVNATFGAPASPASEVIDDCAPPFY